MNKIFSTIASAFLIMAGCCLSSCDKENDSFKLTGIEGCPSALLSNGRVIVSFAYSGNQFVRIHYPDGQTTHFNYENGTFSGISYTPPKDVADGHGCNTFTRTGEDTYEVNSTGEPALDLSHVDSIKLDADGLPTRITYTGIYQQTGKGRELVQEWGLYALLTFDPATRLLVKQEVFDKDSNLRTTYTYEYDNASGSFSHTELPIHLLGWLYYRYAGSHDFKTVQYLNRRHNIIKITEEDRENGISTTTYTYKYNEKLFPVAVSCNKWNGEEIEIKY